ncbi:MAG: MlaE family lipid ABC transporter permease subunit [Caldimonas sp.]
MPTPAAATISQPTPDEWTLAGSWTVAGLGGLPKSLTTVAPVRGAVVLDGSGLEAVDSAGAWVLKRWLGSHGATASLRNWPPRWRTLMELVMQHAAQNMPPVPQVSKLQAAGHAAASVMQQSLALLGFVGETAMKALPLLARPQRIRWRTVLRNIQIGGFDALPIVGLTSFLLGVVVAYQGADQLRHYGANIFVVDLVGYAMLREFAPLISAIIIAGRSGSAYAAEIGTMVVTEEVDAMRTIDIEPIELLVLPKILALAIALPLLTLFADIAGVFGGMVMARSQLDIGFREFGDRFGQEMQGATLLIGIGKSLVFAFIIALIGCFQGFRTRGSADSVGRQTTLAVVQSIFLVIVADALFSVVFSILDL